ncbi:MAG: heparan-alpha-glucosaminide N-acetyltransferase domain-containing protein [Planctomycetota bacterium]
MDPTRRDAGTVLATPPAPPPLATPPAPSMAPAPAHPRRPHWPELDLLRGFAAVLMVLNHAGVRWKLTPGHVLDEALVFSGSLAPVVFFTVTGMGRGVQAAANGRHRPWSDTLTKALLLLLADAALWLSPARPLGMDFLGFIGVSTLLVEGLARSARPRAAALATLGVVLGARLLLVPALRPWFDGAGDGALLPFFLGARDLAGFSYPPCPWLAYPVVGFLLGDLAQRHPRRARTLAGGVGMAAAGAVALGLACAFMAARGLVFFRWGTSSFAFTVLGFAAIAAASTTVLLVARSARFTAVASLPGTSSLLVVPLHYGLIAAVDLLWPDAASDGRFPALAALGVVLALASARGLDRVLARAVGPHTGRAAWRKTLVATITLLAITAAAADSPAHLPCMIATQIAVGVLFLLRRR